MNSFFKKSVVFLATSVACVGVSYAKFTIAYNFAAGTSDADKVTFNNAKDFWESQLTGYVDGVSRTVTIDVSLFSEAASGGSITLGSAGPNAITRVAVGNRYYTATSSGTMQFNNHPDATAAGGYDAGVVRHELGHVLGFGTLWTFQTQFNDANGSGVNVYSNGTGQYTGTNAITAYRAEFGQAAATFVPVELDFGPGTEDGHWNESPNVATDTNPGDNVAAPSNAGRSFNDEMMTGNKSGSLWLSKTTLGQFQDLGFTVVPEPSTGVLVMVASFALLRRQRRA